MYRRYFKVESGPFHDEIVKAKIINDAAWEEFKAIARSIGACDEEFLACDDRIKLLGFFFKDNEPPFYMGKSKHDPEAYRPKLNTKAGKDLKKKISSIKTKDNQSLLKIVGLNNMIFSDKGLNRSKLVVLPYKNPIGILSIPWEDEDPEKIEAHRNKVYDLGDDDYEDLLDHLLWLPPKGFEEIKKWEILKLIDEYNDSLGQKEAC